MCFAVDDSPLSRAKDLRQHFESSLDVRYFSEHLIFKIPFLGHVRFIRNVELGEEILTKY